MYFVPMAQRKRLECVMMDGGPIDLGHYSIRVDEESTLEWFLGAVAKAVEWPASHISLTLNHVTVVYIKLKSQRTETNSL